jgi:peptide/nickel transport system substrate-binding protein
MLKRLLIPLLAALLIMAIVLPGCEGEGETYALTIGVDPSGAGTATFTGTSPFAAGASIPVQATANSGFEFAGWIATAGYFDDPLATSTNFNMPAAAATITANFGTDVFPTGAMIGELVFSEEKSPTATVTKIAAGQVDLYLQPGIVSAEVFEAITLAGLPYDMSYGSYRDIRYNPIGPLFPGTGELNPFSVIEIREAMNWLIDRSYVVGEILGGLGAEIFALPAKQFPESAERYATIVQAIEDYYALKTPAEVLTIITPYMTALNCTLVSDVWQYDGSPVELLMIIRTDLDPFPEAGDYVADRLEDVGFTVTRLYKTGGEAAPMWIYGDPADGEWHVYDGGWGIPGIPRDQASQFAGMTCANWYPLPLYYGYEAQALTWDDGWPTPYDPAYDGAGGYYQLCQDLFNRDFASLTQREAMFEQAMWGMAKFGAANLLCDMAGATPYGFNVDLIVNLSYGPGEGWTRALHFFGAEGPLWRDQMTIEMESLMVQPWNPVDGSNWVYDLTIIRDAVSESALLQDPTSGLYYPNRIESGELTIANNLPVLFAEDPPPDWLDLTVLGEGEYITVPDDAWSAWNATTQSWMTCAERFPNPAERIANRKCVFIYPSDIFSFPMHDGSTLSLADILCEMILPLDIAQADSPIYESAREAQFDAFMAVWKGYRITSVDPLTIEVYGDNWYLDPEWNMSTDATFPLWKQGGSNPWHMISIGYLAARDNLAKFGSGAAESEELPWMDYTKGDAMSILEGKLTDVQTGAHADEGFVPFETAIQDAYTAFGLGSVATEASARYTNLQSWYDTHAHFWVDMGLYYVDEVFPVEKVVVLKRFEDHPDPYDRWLWLLD